MLTLFSGCYKVFNQNDIQTVNVVALTDLQL